MTLTAHNLNLTDLQHSWSILKFFFQGWYSNLESFNDGQHANYLHYWCMYDIDVLSHLVHLAVTVGLLVFDIRRPTFGLLVTSY